MRMVSCTLCIVEKIPLAEVGKKEKERKFNQRRRPDCGN